MYLSPSRSPSGSRARKEKKGVIHDYILCTSEAGRERRRASSAALGYSTLYFLFMPMQRRESCDGRPIIIFHYARSIERACLVVKRESQVQVGFQLQRERGSWKFLPVRIASVLCFLRCLREFHLTNSKIFEALSVFLWGSWRIQGTLFK